MGFIARQTDGLPFSLAGIMVYDRAIYPVIQHVYDSLQMRDTGVLHYQLRMHVIWQVSPLSLSFASNHRADEASHATSTRLGSVFVPLIIS